MAAISTGFAVPRFQILQSKASWHGNPVRAYGVLVQAHE
jgi:hypothetical protein